MSKKYSIFITVLFCLFTFGFGAALIILPDRDFSEQKSPPQDLADAVAAGRIQAVAVISWREFFGNFPIRYFYPTIDYHLEHVAGLVKQFEARRVALIAPEDIYEHFPERFRRIGIKLMPKYIRQFPLCGGFTQNCGAAVYDFKYKESRDASDFKSFCVAYMVSSRYGVDTKGFDFSRLPREYDGMDTQVFKGELGTMRDVLGEIQSDMYKSMEKNKPARNKEQER